MEPIPAPAATTGTAEIDVASVLAQWQRDAAGRRSATCFIFGAP